MREFYRAHNFARDTVILVKQCEGIVRDYMAEGLRLTLRQLYYQLVTKNLIRNEEKQYKRLSTVLSDARLMGLIDWEAIEDRVRVPRIPSEFADLKELAEAALNSYRLPRWDDQDYYVEVWVEKDALSGVLAPLTSEYHVPLMVNRGYSSQSAMHDAARRFLTHCHGIFTIQQAFRKMDVSTAMEIRELDVDSLGDPPVKPLLLYLGDHDPSGEDMVRDIRDRLKMFGIDVEVRKLALTMEQVKKYNPPPNPSKLTDPRSAEYVAKHGAMSWEVDALPPNVLHRLIRNAIEGVLDVEKMDAIKGREEEDKKRLRKAVEKIVGKK